MKRRRLLAMGLALVFVMGLLSPSVALASRPQTFEALGAAYISGAYVSWNTGPVQHAVNEPVDGLIAYSNWDALLGASVRTTHDGVIVLNPDGTFGGSLHGTFTIETHTGTVEGNMRGRVSGTWNPVAPDDFTGTVIDDYGTWTSTKGSGTFEGVKAGGTWEAHLAWNSDAGTYVGTITLRGAYH